MLLHNQILHLEQPHLPIIILHKSRPHLHNIILINPLHVLTNPITALQAVHLLSQFLVLFELVQVIVNRNVGEFFIVRGVVSDVGWRADADFSFDVCLDVPHFFPVGIVLTFEECAHEERVAHHRPLVIVEPQEGDVSVAEVTVFVVALSGVRAFGGLFAADVEEGFDLFLNLEHSSLSDFSGEDESKLVEAEF